ncbi:hypothetical protein WN944_021221 [Citrus x changshan-huyou]|uniref:Uncharacterized protein n=1 Tax=Citrus x changshan-huyou TaxID=2935761 RepID=A0AAP0MWG2_9ROSI
MLSMLTASDNRGRPLYQANDVIPFQLKHGPKIFPQSHEITQKVKGLMGPEYGGQVSEILTSRDTGISKTS